MRVSILHLAPRSVLVISSLLGTVALAAGCLGADNPLCPKTDFDPDTGFVSDFGAGVAAAKVETFLSATGHMVLEVNDLETKLKAACTAIATDLGVPATELVPSNPSAPGAAVKTACQRAALEIRTILQDNLPSQAQLTVVYTPAQCGIDVDAYADCVGRCEVKASADVTVTCEPGRLYGTCSGTCSGSCSGSCSGGCEGTCSGTCTGSCSGTCYGQCEGTCTQKNAQGECVGTCTGTCTGTCSSTCSGQCNAECNGQCSAMCTGECRGECSVDFQAPRCDGDVEVTASAECQAACDADLEWSVTCTDPVVSAEIYADVTPAQKQKLTTLAATLEAHLPVVLQIAVDNGARLTASADAFVDSLRGLDSVVDAGAKAAACTVSAVDAALAAAARIDVSVMVSIEVTASVDAMGML
jgi:modification target Cys-rich repeat protein